MYLNHVHPARYSTEDSVLIVQPRSGHRCDEELGPVCPRPFYFHAQEGEDYRR